MPKRTVDLKLVKDVANTLFDVWMYGKPVTAEQAEKALRLLQSIKPRKRGIKEQLKPHRRDRLIEYMDANIGKRQRDKKTGKLGKPATLAAAAKKASVLCKGFNPNNPNEPRAAGVDRATAPFGG